MPVFYKKSSIDALLREKARVEKNIQEMYSEYVTIMFTDIAGYTSYVETHGDINAKSLLQQHNDILFSVIQDHGGRVVKTIGDAVMAAFAVPGDAAEAAAAIQQKLKAYNREVQAYKKINIRIGLHAGEALKDGNDYFGDAVNIAARIEPAGKAGQILVSHSVYTAIKDDNQFFCSYYGEKQAKGKTDPLKLYRLFLSADEQEKQVQADKKQQQHKKDKKDELEQAETRDVTFTPEKPLVRYDLIWKTSIPVLIVVLAVLFYPGLFHRDSTDNGLTAYTQAFTLFREGKLNQAKDLFVSIGRDTPLCKEGLAAVAYREKAFQEAEKLCDQSVNIQNDILYPRVIKGNIFFDRGELASAEKNYTQALALNSNLPWQKGEAYFRMGRIRSMANTPEQALEYYNKALSLDNQNSAIMTAKGVILEKIGDLENAVETFKNARNLSSDNAMARAFYSRARLKLETRKDKEKQERIDTLVAELLERMNNREDQDLNIGSRTGVKQGMTFKVYSSSKGNPALDGKIIGAVQVMAADDESSKCRILKTKNQIPVPCLVEAVPL
ncbi:MAG: adenylate/guanylate cyclase domain-containing protein [Thermodesulfobacteriota bacterium]|nr:adenylate/guanylate cyclase domain-containing protein [Thermodesulfobacteriota bacterium]